MHGKKRGSLAHEVPDREAHTRRYRQAHDNILPGASPANGLDHLVHHGELRRDARHGPRAPGEELSLPPEAVPRGVCLLQGTARQVLHPGVACGVGIAVARAHTAKKVCPLLLALDRCTQLPELVLVVEEDLPVALEQGRRGRAAAAGH
eukprot:scaffold30_cov255-Pinguiococcus_pyrenoidosus.AAC.1